MEPRQAAAAKKVYAFHCLRGAATVNGNDTCTWREQQKLMESSEARLFHLTQ